MEVKLADPHYIAPPQLGIWLPPALPPSAEDERMLRVLLDQLARAPIVGSYQPRSDAPVLRARRTPR